MIDKDLPTAMKITILNITPPRHALKFEQLTSILFLAYRFLNVGESIHAMIFENIKDHFISKVEHGKIANPHVLWKSANKV
jgi:hypothetical protein